MRAGERTILHVDMDAFFAAIEQRDNPAYRGRPLIVGGRRGSPRVVVSTCSYEARRYGIHSAMPLQEALRLCPEGIFVPGNMDKYIDVSRQIRQVLYTFSPRVEPVSIDEAFLDMTGCEHFYPNLRAMGRQLKQAIYDRVQLTASVGIAPNKFLAKLASETQKPDGLVVITADEVDRFLLPQPVSALWGVGRKTASQLQRYGVETVGQLRKLDKRWLESRFGKAGVQLYRLARGQDDRPVDPGGERKSIGHEVTFPRDITDWSLLEGELVRLVAAVGRRLRKCQMSAKTVTIKLRYGDFTTKTRSKTLTDLFEDDNTILRLARSLLRPLASRPVRLVGVYVSSLEEMHQPALFPGDPAKIDKLVDRINERFGAQVIYRYRLHRQADDQDINQAD